MIDTTTLREIAEAATQGAWVWREPSQSPQWGDRGPDLTGEGDRLVLSAVSGDDGANLYVDAKDAEYITATNPQTVLALLDEIDRLRG